MVDLNSSTFTRRLEFPTWAILIFHCIFSWLRLSCLLFLSSVVLKLTHLRPRRHFHWHFLNDGFTCTMNNSSNFYETSRGIDGFRQALYKRLVARKPILNEKTNLTIYVMVIGKIILMQYRSVAYLVEIICRDVNLKPIEHPDWGTSKLHSPSILFLNSFVVQVTLQLYHMTISANRNVCQMHKASIKILAVIRFCKHESHVCIANFIVLPYFSLIHSDFKLHAIISYD